MECKVSMLRPNGTRAVHVGQYMNPGAAMDVVQAMHPDCVVNAAVATAAASPRPRRSCDELGLCQSVVSPCPTGAQCARKNNPFYFAPGTIEACSSDLQLEADAGWLLDLSWKDVAMGLVIVAIIAAIVGYVG
jgi:hypothetical protein